MKIEPCPFCGGNNVGFGPGGGYIRCQSRECLSEGPCASTKEEVVRRWNAVAKKLAAFTAMRKALEYTLIFREFQPEWVVTETTMDFVKKRDAALALADAAEKGAEDA